MPGVEEFRGIRIVASRQALDSCSWPTGAMVLRLAPDEVVVLGLDESHVSRHEIDDGSAIQVVEHGFCGVRLPRFDFDHWFRAGADWELPIDSPSFAQGAVAGVPVKLLIGDEDVLVVTRSSLRHELEARL